jgi:hypothetical protein
MDKRNEATARQVLSMPRVLFVVDNATGQARPYAAVYWDLDADQSSDALAEQAAKVKEDTCAAPYHRN